MNSRDANLGDIEDITKLIQQLRSDYTPDPERLFKDIEAITTSADRAIILALEDQQVYGMAIVNVVLKLEKREARVDEVVVDELARGKGVGSFLMNAVEEWCKQKDCTAIEFTSRPTRTAANGLYQKLGYKIRETNVYHKSL